MHRHISCDTSFPAAFAARCSQVPVAEVPTMYNVGMTRTIVGVLRGGTSSEYELSLKTGATMLAALPEEHYDTRDIFIDKRGIWHLRGMPVAPHRALQQVDVVLNGLHGGMGEDGTVQRFLDKTGIPYAGAG